MSATGDGDTVVSVAEFRAKMGDYLALVRGGARVVLTSHGRPVAHVAAPPPQPLGLPFGEMAGRLRIAPDFDETPADLIAAMEGDEGR